MQDYEKLGAFYLGQSYDLAQAARRDDLILYDAKDLTTHAMIIGMTGSGKTGLGIGLIEEAAIDRIPVIAVDPKGDLGNLLLTFPIHFVGLGWALHIRDAQGRLVPAWL
jgi:DNA helicase HerA-like ATPase